MCPSLRIASPSCSSRKKRKAMSASRLRKSAAAFAVTTSIVSAGCCVCSGAIARMTCAANESVAEMRTCPLISLRMPAMRPTSAASAVSTSRATAAAVPPASVRLMPSGVRTRSATPRSCSSAIRRRLTVEASTPSARAQLRGRRRRRPRAGTSGRPSASRTQATTPVSLQDRLAGMPLGHTGRRS